MLVFLFLLVSVNANQVTPAEECDDEDIRMTNPTVIRDDRDTYNLAGGLQICVKGHWAIVCQHGWDGVDAGVACRHLGGQDYEGSKSKLLHFSIHKNYIIQLLWKINYYLLAYL